MGEGNDRPEGQQAFSFTRQCDQFEHIDLPDDVARAQPWHDFVALVRVAGGPRLIPVEGVCRDGQAQAIGHTGLHEVTLTKTSYATVFVSV